MKPPTTEPPFPPLSSPPLPIRINRPSSMQEGDAFVNRSPEEQQENIHSHWMREPAHPEREPAGPTLSWKARPSRRAAAAAGGVAATTTTTLLLPMPAVDASPRSALAPRTDAQANHLSTTADTTSILRKEDIEQIIMPRGEFAVSSMTPPRPPAGDANGSISDLVKPSRSFEQPSSFIPRNPKDSSSPKRRSISRHLQQTAPPREIVNADHKSIHSTKSAKSSGSGLPLAQPPPTVWHWAERTDPDSQEQALFEQRLCEDIYGVAVRKINQNGKSNLRYVKCIPVDDASCGASDQLSVTGRSVHSLVRGLSRRSMTEAHRRERSLERGEAASLADLESQRNLIPLATNQNRKKALVWGKKKDVKLNLDRFLCVRKGKTTYRTRRNPQPASRLLSLITDDVNHPSLDIEAPTKLDRDKFARAFSKFLGVPLEGGDDDHSDEYQSAATVDHSLTRGKGSKQSSVRSPQLSATQSAPDLEASSKRSFRTSRGITVVTSPSSPTTGDHLEISFDTLPEVAETEKSSKGNKTSLMMMASQAAAIMTSTEEQESKKNSSVPTESLKFPDSGPTANQIEQKRKSDDGSDVSSLTGAGFDQEIVEELHNALNELRAELDASRAEAARAVKVAEQAIQSAENSSSKDWNSTVTHKAAEAAALAQKKSAEALAKARLAEDRLAGERRTASFWRKQAEVAEEEAGVLQTRAAAAEVQRAVMAEELESERRKASLMMKTLKLRYAQLESHQSEALEAAMERNRSLLTELDGTRRDLESKYQEAQLLNDTLEEAISPAAEGKNKKKGIRIGRKKKPLPEGSDSSIKMLLAIERAPSRIATDGDTVSLDQNLADQIQMLQSETDTIRRQYQLMRRATADELRSLPESARLWSSQVAYALAASQSELTLLRQKLAVEIATRRRLLHEVQDLRGVVRVYCRPRPVIEAGESPKSMTSAASANPILSVSSQNTLLLHRDKLPNCQDTTPMSFEFDGIFQSDSHQKAVYSEMEALVLGVLDGYKVCIMAYGPSSTGKTHSILGDVRYKTGDRAGEFLAEIGNEGIQLQGVKQLFTVSEQRSERYQDVFSFTIVEVCDERLVDMVAGIKMGDAQGRVQFDDSLSAGRRSVKNRKAVGAEDETSSYSQEKNSSASKGNKTKLEIRTNHDGDTVVQGLISIPVNNYDDVLQVWHQALSQRATRLAEQDIDLAEHESSSHVIATLQVMSTNIATGIGSVGKIHFVDLASADLTTKRPPIGAKTKAATPDPILAGVGNNNEWKFANKSLSTLCEVVSARCQFNRSVPYRNSTLTHLLRDSLEADTKVLMLVCVSSDLKDVQETASALRFASKMRRVNIGKATKHTLGTSS